MSIRPPDRPQKSAVAGRRGEENRISEILGDDLGRDVHAIDLAVCADANAGQSRRTNRARKAIIPGASNLNLSDATRERIKSPRAPARGPRPGRPGARSRRRDGSSRRLRRCGRAPPSARRNGWSRRDGRWRFSPAERHCELDDLQRVQHAERLRLAAANVEGKCRARRVALRVVDFPLRRALGQKAQMIDPFHGRV